MTIPKYILLSELAHNEDIFIITQQCVINDHVYILKYSGSNFLYPEKHYFIRLEDYFKMKKPDENIIEKIIESFCRICVNYTIHPTCMFEEGITFNHKENSFFYPKQLIDAPPASWEKNAFGAISTYLHKNQDIDADVKSQLQQLIEKIVEPSSNFHKSYFEDQKNSEEEEQNDADKSINIKSGNIDDDDNQNQQASNNNNNNSQNTDIFKIEDEDQLHDFLEEQKQYYEDSVLLKYIKDKDIIEPTSLECQNLRNISRFALVYKQVGDHKFAKSLFSYYHQLITNFNKKQEQLFEKEQPQEVKIKIPQRKIVEYLEDLSRLQSYQDGLLHCQLEQKSEEWHKQRKYRITASNFGKVKSSIQAYRNKMVQDQIYPKFFGNDATRYGNQYESEARDQYVKIKQPERYEVREFGLLVDPEYIWIAGSPDGLVYQDNKRIGCIEIKCPYKIKDDKIEDNLNKIDFLQKVNGQIKIKESHVYYAQCQGIMRLSNVDWCDFIIYTQVDIIIVRVNYDQDYIHDLYSRIHEYFFQNLLVENIYPCKSIHIKQQYMDDDQFQELKDNQFNIKYHDYSRPDPEQQEENQDSHNDEDNNNNNQSEQVNNNNSDTESIGNNQEEEFDATIPL